MTDRHDVDRASVTRRARWVRIATGVAAAFGLSMTGFVLGAVVALGADMVEVPDTLFRPVWAVATGVFVIGAGMSVRELARDQAVVAAICATVLLAAAISAILNSIESLGIDRNETFVICIGSLLFGSLLLLGVELQRRREREPVISSPDT